MPCENAVKQVHGTQGVGCGGGEAHFALAMLHPDIPPDGADKVVTGSGGVWGTGEGGISGGEGGWNGGADWVHRGWIWWRSALS